MKPISLPDCLKGVHIHFVGIKGTGNSALVEILCKAGAIISGSDIPEQFYTDEILEKAGIKVMPFSEENITDKIQYVIYSSAYNPKENPDLAAAFKKGIPCILYSQALGLYSQKSYSIGICGVHGKTGTTGLTGTILKELDMPVQVLAGSVINSFGNSCTYTSENFFPSSENYFVAETCEYQRHFMSFCPKKIILTSVESDHQDYYKTYDDIKNAFTDYICKLPDEGQLIFCADDKGAFETAKAVSKIRKGIELIPYGKTAAGNYRVEFGKIENGFSNFYLHGLGELRVKVPGRHIVLDAAAAAALACELLKSYGKNPKEYYSQIKKGLENFSGGKRRSEIIGKAYTRSGNFILFIDDYAHHPTALKTTIEGFRNFYKGYKIIVDFMSHTYSRTAALLEEFAGSFQNADIVVLHKIYASAREKQDGIKVSGTNLFEAVKKYHNNAVYYEEVMDAQDYVIEQLNKSAGSEYSNSYLFITMGAGDNWKLGKAVCRILNEEKND